jgi:uncharacterized membrane protein YfcA
VRPAFPRTCWLKVGGIGLAVGTMNGLFGVGGGFMVVPALIVILGFPTRLAIGTSLSIIASSPSAVWSAISNSGGSTGR